jgi:hypothetical protein
MRQQKWQSALHDLSRRLELKKNNLLQFCKLKNGLTVIWDIKTEAR